MTVGLGKIPEELSDVEKAEKTRKVAAVGAKALREYVNADSEVLVDPVWSPHAAAVGASLSTFSYVS